jgi:hypothetical protein
MGRTAWTAWLGVFAVLGSGCATGPLLDNPNLVRPVKAARIENPMYVPLGPTATAYNAVFERVLDVVDDYFEISYANRYDGRVMTFPRIAPGLEQLWKNGSPDFDQRLEASLQTIRHRAEVLIQPAEDGGFFVQVTVFKELEDLPRPVRATAGAASFRDAETVERQFEVIDPTVFESTWIPFGRNVPLEQAILEKLRKCM